MAVVKTKWSRFAAPDAYPSSSFDVHTEDREIEVKVGNYDGWFPENMNAFYSDADTTMSHPYFCGIIQGAQGNEDYEKLKNVKATSLITKYVQPQSGYILGKEWAFGNNQFDIGNIETRFYNSIGGRLTTRSDNIRELMPSSNINFLPFNVYDSEKGYGEGCFDIWRDTGNQFVKRGTRFTNSEGESILFPSMGNFNDGYGGNAFAFYTSKNILTHQTFNYYLCILEIKNKVTGNIDTVTLNIPYTVPKYSDDGLFYRPFRVVENDASSAMNAVMLFKTKSRKFYIATIASYGTTSLIKSGILYTAVDNMFVDIDTSENYDASHFGVSSFTYADSSLYDINGLFNSIFGGTEEWEVEGPDAKGKGDVYDEIDNVEEVVGGDVYLTKTITTDTAAPNSNYPSISYGGLYGTYRLTQQNLTNYSNSLAFLYSHSSDFLLGLGCSERANNITKNTVRLFYIPVSLPSSIFTSNKFSIGNTGIKANGVSWAQYELQTDQVFDTADYLTTNIYTWDVAIGYIYHNYDNYLDFAPYSSASIFIPYIGEQSLPINLIQSQTNVAGEKHNLKLSFRLDITSGDFVCLFFCDDISLCQWNGNCAKDVQLASTDNTPYMRAGFSQLAGVVGALSNVSDPITGTANILNSMVPPQVTPNQHMIGTQNTNGNSGWLSSQNIYITVERPVMWRPYDYSTFIGYPTNKIANIGSISGFARVSDIHLNSKATEEEKEQIQAALAKGVIFGEN